MSLFDDPVGLHDDGNEQALERAACFMGWVLWGAWVAAASVSAAGVGWLILRRWAAPVLPMEEQG